MAKVSIIVPVYNVESYLEQCIESIINQSLKDIEIICVNDGSTDSSREILERFSRNDKRIKVIQKGNTGYGNTMNIGMSYASGEYIGIVESDDYIEEGMFERLSKMGDSQKAEVVKADYYEYRTKTGTKKQAHSLTGCPFNRVFCPMDELFAFEVTQSIWSAIYRREFLEHNKIVFNETPGASFQDVSFAFQVMASVKRLIFLPDAVLNYRIDNENSSVQSPMKVFCICDEFQKIQEFLDTNPDKRDRLQDIALVLKYREYKSNLWRMASAFQYAFLCKMSEEFKRHECEGKLNCSKWKDNEWNDLQRIIHKRDDYYLQTGRDYIDPRLDSIPLLNAKIYIDGFVKKLREYNNHILVYGAGIIGTRVFRIIRELEEDVRVAGFVVSDKEGNRKFICDIPVHNINVFQNLSEKYLVLVAVKDSDQYEIIKNLFKNGFTNVISVDKLLRRALEEVVRK